MLRRIGAAFVVEPVVLYCARDFFTPISCLSAGLSDTVGGSAEVADCCHAYFPRFLALK